MVTPAPTRIRALAATLISASGVAHIAALWFRDLTLEALLAALVGTAYIIIGVGLFGQSRFTLFAAMIIPAAGSALLLQHYDLSQLNEPRLLGLTVNALVIVICAGVLWRVRNNPSV